MADVSKSRYRGLLIPHYKYEAENIWATHSDYSESGARVGFPEFQGSKRNVVLKATGEYSVADTSVQTIETITQKGGFPGPDGATYLYREGTSGNYYGWDAPNMISGCDFLIESANSPNGVSIGDDKFLIVYSDSVNGDIQYSLINQDLSIDGQGQASNANDIFTESGFDEVVYPCPLVLPDGRILVFWIDDISTSSEDKLQVSYSYSDDNAATWELGSRYNLQTNLTGLTRSNVDKMSVAYANGQILLLISVTDSAASTTYKSWVYQYASNDLGNSFSLVEQWDGESGENGTFAEVVGFENTFYIAWVDVEGPYAKFKRIGNAFDKLGNSETISVQETIDNASVTSGRITDGGLSLSVGEEGSLYLFVEDFSHTNEIIVYRSSDFGDSWSPLGMKSASVPGSVFNTANTYVSDFWNFAPHRGGFVGCMEDGHTYLLYIGGFSTVSMSSTSDGKPINDQACWFQDWIPLDTPDNMNWVAAASTGTATIASTTSGDFYMETSVTTVQAQEYSYGFLSVSSAESMRVNYTFELDGGSSDCSVLINAADGTTDYKIEVHAYLTGGTDLTIEVLDDHNSSTSMGSHQFVGVVGAELIVELRGDSFAVYGREGVLPTTRRNFSELITNTGLTDAATAAAGSIRWGIPVPLSHVSTCRWYRFHFNYGEYSGLIDWELGLNQDNLFGKPYSIIPSYLADGMHLSAVDGPTVKGEEFSIAPSWDYPITNIVPQMQPSPNRYWRSADTTVPVNIAVRFDSNAEDSHFGNGLMGLYLDNINWSKGKVQGRTGGSWSDLFEFECYETVAFARHGSTIIPSTSGSTADSQYYQANELKDCYFEFPNGTVRKIDHNTGGNWGTGAIGEKRPVVYLADTDSTEDASGNGKIWFRRVLCIHQILGTPTYDGYRLVIDPDSDQTSPPEGYHQIGAMQFGVIELFGWDPAYSRSVEYSVEVDVQEFDDGRKRTRRRQKPRQVVDMAFADPVDARETQQLYTPDYVKAHSGATAEPAALRRDTPYMMAGNHAHLHGVDGLVVYIPYIEQMSGATVTQVYRANLAKGSFLGRITTPVQIQTVRGDEHYNEYIQGGNLTIEEEL
jgi:hypothetical protein